MMVRSLLFFLGLVAPGFALRLSSTANIAVTQSRNTSSATIVANASSLPSVGPWPQAFILGGQKCASSSLWMVLKRHLQLCTSQPHRLLGDGPVAFKEVHFFDTPSNYKKSVTWYLRHFGHDPKCFNGKYMDATPNYIHEPGAATKLFDVLPAALRTVVRFVVILREPISRDLSWYNHQRSNGFNVNLGAYESYVDNAFALESQTPPAFGKYNYLSWGVYHRLLNNWLKFFSRKQLYVVSFHVMIKKQEQTIEQVTSFLGVNPETLRGFALPHDNKRTHDLKLNIESVACATRAKLTAFFSPHNERLYTMLADSQASGAAPTQEPAFERFPSITC